MNKPLAIITGAGSGIGRATSIKFHENGYQVACLDLNLETAKETVEMISNEGKAYHVDVISHEEIKKISEVILKEFSNPDVLVNCAGISPSPMPVHLFEVDEWNRVININLNGSFYMMKYFIPSLLKNTNSSIVNISSVLGVVANPTTAGYAASKHGIVGLTKAAALDYAKQGLRVNCVGPGVIETNMNKDILKDIRIKEMLTNQTPLGRVAAPSEVANLIYFLCSDKATFITGSFFAVDGGYTAV